MIQLSRRSLSRLRGVHPDLVLVVSTAARLCLVDFVVIEGLRNYATQQRLVQAGAVSATNSKHLLGQAVSLAGLVGGKIRWDWPLYADIALAVKVAGEDLNIPITWGGDWPKFKDGTHFELREVR